MERPGLVERILGSPHAYYRLFSDVVARRSCKQFSAYQAETPLVNLHGDAHLEQFAVTRSSYGLEDFDHGGFGPAVVDLLRFAGSIRLACAAVTFPCKAEVVVAVFAWAFLGEAVSRILRSYLMSVHEQGQHLSLTQITQEQFDRRELLPRSLRELCVDGMLGFCQLDIPGPAVELLRELRVPVVWLNASTGGDCVRPDDRGAIAAATAHLLALGHRRIAYVDFGLDHRPDRGQGHASGEQRRTGYRETMVAADLEPRVVAKTWPRQGEAPLHWGMPGDDRLELARTILATPDRPTAVIATHPASAAPFVLAASSLGLAIPRDLSLIGLYHQRQVEFGLPLSTLIVPHEAMARAGIAAVLRKVERPDEVQPEVVVPCAPPEGATIAPPPD